MIKNILYGPKMGDFVRSLYVSHHLYKRDGTKSNVILSNIGDSFENGLVNTFNEFKLVIEQQEFCNSFELYDEQTIDLNIAEFRTSKFLFKTNWRDLLCKTYLNSEDPFPGAWLRFDEKEVWDDTLIINRKPKTPFVPQLMEPYLQQIKKYKKRIYVGYEEHYQQFPLKEYCTFYQPKDIFDWFSVISKAEKVIACQSGPLDIAISLDRPTLAELLPRSTNPDWINLFGEAKYHSNLEFTPF
jgi:hypothetical protein